MKRGGRKQGIFTKMGRGGGERGVSLDRGK